MTEKLIVKQFYETATMFLFYEASPTANALQKRIVKLLFDICGKKGAKRCIKQIEDASIVSTYTDGALLESNGGKSHSFVVDIKLDILTAHKISLLKRFDTELFVQDLEDAAFVGSKSACKLLACLHWIGFDRLGDKNKAKDIWEMLAVDGDRMALYSLIYACDSLGLTEEKAKWQRICRMLDNACDSFMPIVAHDGNDDCPEEEIHLANIIMFMKRRGYIRENESIDRAMIYYIMHSDDDYLAKMDRIATESNFFTIILAEDKPSSVKIGF